jgi:hypothetical protein
MKNIFLRHRLPAPVAWRNRMAPALIIACMIVPELWEECRDKLTNALFP